MGSGGGGGGGSGGGGVIVHDGGGCCKKVGEERGQEEENKEEGQEAVEIAVVSPRPIGPPLLRLHVAARHFCSVSNGLNDLEWLDLGG